MAELLLAEDREMQTPESSHGNGLRPTDSWKMHLSLHKKVHIGQIISPRVLMQV